MENNIYIYSPQKTMLNESTEYVCKWCRISQTRKLIILVPFTYYFDVAQKISSKSVHYLLRNQKIIYF